MTADIHTHTFPEKIARAAMEKLSGLSHTLPFTDGTADGLRRSMAEAGIDVSLVLPVATNPAQVEHVNDSSILLNDAGGETGIYSFGCMHPEYPAPEKELERLKKAGIRGIKLHPVYQGVDFDDEKYIRILKTAFGLGMWALVHAGLDVGFPGVEHVSPRMILRVVERLGGDRLILAHMGAWRQWEEAAGLLSGTGVMIDTSFSIGRMTPADDTLTQPEMLSVNEAEDIIKAYGADRVLFGTDSPWGGQKESLELFGKLDLSEADRDRILWLNAKRVLGI
ncbi:MAG: amidohydrolase family protein [Clostridia bacterium]|nr:amidohydrolase family protein [Clostridia bacterium]